MQTADLIRLILEWAREAVCQAGSDTHARYQDIEVVADDRKAPLGQREGRLCCFLWSKYSVAWGREGKQTSLRMREIARMHHHGAGVRGQWGVGWRGVSYALLLPK
jgi:hypothetical protein